MPSPPCSQTGRHHLPQELLLHPKFSDLPSTRPMLHGMLSCFDEIQWPEAAALSSERMRPFSVMQGPLPPRRWEAADPDILFQPRHIFPQKVILQMVARHSCHSSGPSYYLFFHCFILIHICFIYVVAGPRRDLLERAQASEAKSQPFSP